MITLICVGIAVFSVLAFLDFIKASKEDCCIYKRDTMGCGHGALFGLYILLLLIGAVMAFMCFCIKYLP